MPILRNGARERERKRKRLAPGAVEEPLHTMELFKNLRRYALRDIARRALHVATDKLIICLLIVLAILYQLRLIVDSLKNAITLACMGSHRQDAYLSQGLFALLVNVLGSGMLGSHAVELARTFGPFTQTVDTLLKNVFEYGNFTCTIGSTKPWCTL